MTTSSTFSTPIPDYYQVKFRHIGPTVHYGIVQRFSEDAKDRYLKTKQLTVTEAVTGNPFYLDEDDVTPIKTAHNDEYYQHLVAMQMAAQTKSDTLPDGCVKGKLFRVDVADGYAWYVVTRVSKKTAHIEWRGYSPDNYMDLTLGYGGKFDREIIERHIARTEGWRKLTAGHAT